MKHRIHHPIGTSNALFIGFLIFLISYGCDLRIASLAPTNADVPDLVVIDTYIEAQMTELRIPGLALGVVRGDSIFYLHGYGVADPSGRPVTPQTPFILGSVTKSFTALAIMQLVEGGRIDLDQPVQAYLPWFRVVDAEASSRITVRHLLYQTSGLSTLTGREEMANGDTGDGALEANVRHLSGAALDRPIGVSFEYSNSNYDVLGMIVQAVSGQSYESYVREHIFAPLEMRHSHTSQRDAVADGMATGYWMWFGYPFPAEMPFVRSCIPSGYLISSAEDMAHYLIAQINGGRYGDAAVLSPQGIAELHRPAIQIDSSSWYGMGWVIGTTNGEPTTSHPGTTPNFSCNVILITEGQWGIVILMNTASILGNARMNSIPSGVVNLLLGRQPLAPQSDQLTFMIMSVIVPPMAIVAVQIAWSAIALQRGKGGQGRGSQAQAMGFALLKFTLNMALALFLLTVIPQLFQLPFPVMALYMPDITAIDIVCAALALIFGALNVRRAIQLYRSPILL